MLHSLLYQGGKLRTDVEPAEFPAVLKDPAALLWLDFEDPSDDELRLVERTFKFHPLAMEDLRTLNQRPKLERYDGYVYMVLYNLELTEDDRVRRVELDVVVGPNYVVSVHGQRFPPLEELKQRCKLRPEVFEPNPLGFLVYHVADGIVDGYFPLVDHIEERLSQVEEQALDPQGRNVLGDIFAIRKDLLIVRNTVDPSRDVFNVLARRDQSFLDASTTLYFTDVYDHLLRVSNRIDGLRELAAAALETHLSVQSNQLNLTVERLTAVTLVLMIITLITGFCGMNVQFPGRDDSTGLYFAVGFMLVIGALSLYYSHRRGWL
jgi:magnesium transporter